MSGLSNLYLTKTRNQGTNTTEVHIVDAEKLYSTFVINLPTAFRADEINDGIFLIYHGDLWQIKLRNTSLGGVEFHRATLASRYQTLDLHVATAFNAPGDGDSAHSWAVDDKGVYQIKAKDTSLGFVEVHRTPHTPSSSYQTFDIHAMSLLPVSERANGTLRIHNADLYFIKYRNTLSWNVEVHVFPFSDRYQTGRVFNTAFSIADGANGTWDIGPNANLYFLKGKNTSVGRVEVHVASAASGYGQITHNYQTIIEEIVGDDGLLDVD